MRLTRRTALAVGIGTIALGRPALAQAWRPTRDVEFVIPFGVGGGADLMARVIQKIITDEHSGRILVDAALAEEQKVKKILDYAYI